MQEVVICEHARGEELREKGVVRVLATSLVTEGQRERRVEGEKDWQRQKESMFEFCVFITVNTAIVCPFVFVSLLEGFMCMYAHMNRYNTTQRPAKILR